MFASRVRIPNLLQLISPVFLSGWLVVAWTSPVLAESFWDGQLYFGFSGMLAGARNAKLDEAAAPPDPAFTPGAEVVSNVGYGASLYLGWLFDSNWRTELEIARRAVTLDNVSGPGGLASLDGDLTVHAAFFNIARDFRSQAWVTPYVGAGLGVAIHDLDLERAATSTNLPKSDATTLAFQGMFGIELEAGEDVDIIVGYRYVNYYAPDYSGFSLDFVDFHNFELGLRLYPEDW